MEKLILISILILINVICLIFFDYRKRRERIDSENATDKEEDDNEKKTIIKYSQSTVKLEFNRPPLSIDRSIDEEIDNDEIEVETDLDKVDRDHNIKNFEKVESFDESLDVGIEDIERISKLDIERINDEEEIKKTKISARKLLGTSFLEDAIGLLDDEVRGKLSSLLDDIDVEDSLESIEVEEKHIEVEGFRKKRVSNEVDRTSVNIEENINEINNRFNKNEKI